MAPLSRALPLTGPHSGGAQVVVRRLSVAEVAYLLGYSEPAAFHRAFNRWYGTTPEASR